MRRIALLLNRNHDFGRRHCLGREDVILFQRTATGQIVVLDENDRLATNGLKVTFHLCELGETQTRLGLKQNLPRVEVTNSFGNRSVATAVSDSRGRFTEREPRHADERERYKRNKYSKHLIKV